jgi:hypothetical protein
MFLIQKKMNDSCAVSDNEESTPTLHQPELDEHVQEPDTTEQESVENAVNDEEIEEKENENKEEESEDEEEPDPEEPPKKRAKTVVIRKQCTVKELLEEKIGNFIREAENVLYFQKNPHRFLFLKAMLCNASTIFSLADTYRAAFKKNERGTCEELVTKKMKIPVDEITPEQKERFIRYARFLMKITE